MSILGPTCERSPRFLVLLRRETDPEDDDHDPSWYVFDNACGPRDALAWFFSNWESSGTDMLGSRRACREWEAKFVLLIGTMFWTRYPDSPDGPEEFDSGFEIKTFVAAPTRGSALATLTRCMGLRASVRA